uniref:Uncharacterized protein n=1 Tax=Medicago truncatula TaxID=3880 RepID=I3T960_MEDTR|nr:unknown [Medicago truncatula]
MGKFTINFRFISLLVNPRVEAALPCSRSLREPQTNFLVGAFNRITSVNNVPPNLNSKVTTNSSRLGLSRVCGTNNLSASSHNILPFPNHGNNRARDNVLHQSAEERLCRQISIVLLSKSTLHIQEFQTFQVETLLLKPADNLTNESSLNTIRLDHDESLFGHLGF